VTLDMLTSVLLDYSCRLTPGTSDWAVMGGYLEVLNRLRRPLLPAGPHVQGGATARHGYSLARHLRGWPAQPL